MTWSDYLPKLGQFTAIPAAMIDETYLNENKRIIDRLSTFLKLRIIYLFLFIPLSIIDLTVSAFLGLSYGLLVGLTSDRTQDSCIQNMKKYATLFSKNLLSLLATPIGLWDLKLNAFYFIVEKNRTSGIAAGGKFYETNMATLQSPQSIEELQNLIKKAGREGYVVIPRGAGYSQGKQFLPDEKKAIVMDLHALNSIVINPTEKTATVGAGVIWSDLQQQANRHKLAIKVMQASNVFSVGGSIGTNIHGWDHQTGMLSNTIRHMTIVNAKGELQDLTPQDQLFHAITGGLGLFGTVVSVTMDLTDNERLREVAVDVPVNQYVQHFKKTVLNDPKQKMHLYRLSLDPDNLLGSGVAVSYVKEDPDAEPEVTPNLQTEAPHGTRFERVMVNLARHFDWLRKQYWNSEKTRLLANTSPSLSTNDIMRPAINAMFNGSVSETEWLQEYFLPEENLSDFLAELGKILMDNNVVLLNASVRFVKQQNKSPFSYARGCDRYAVVLAWNQSLRASEIIQVKKWLRQAQALSVAKGGSYYLPYQQVSSLEDFDKSYPFAKEAEAYKKEIDPETRFTSGFHQKYMVESTRKNYFKEIMSNEESKNKFTGFLEHVLQRVDAQPFYTLLEDIMTYNDTHAEIYQELCQRLPEIMPSTLSDISHVLHSLSAIKGDLGEQARALLPDDLTHIDGLVEIGYPGRFIHGFQSSYQVTGQITAVFEHESITDYIQTGYPKPYGTFQALDYQRPNLASLANNSADVITCYVGLHHFPPEELDTFLNDVRRVLREGGHFLLVDHDVVDEVSMSMAHMAHTVFNAVTGASLDEEMNERRDFKSMQTWREILAHYGLNNDINNDQNVAMIRAGDPSQNRMVSMIKPITASINPSTIGFFASRENTTASQPQDKPTPPCKKMSCSTD